MELRDPRKALMAEAQECERDPAPQPSHRERVVGLSLLSQPVSQTLVKDGTLSCHSARCGKHQRCEGSPLHFTNPVTLSICVFVRNSRLNYAKE